mmetsp:Transcript_12083/g.18667  ORF Transcript_12083/g.18667 Transcript_12083/m.18667 type:complete len:233 (+) Transcript_12083:853-1551(+)
MAVAHLLALVADFVTFFNVVAGPRDGLPSTVMAVSTQGLKLVTSLASMNSLGDVLCIVVFDITELATKRAAAEAAEEVVPHVLQIISDDFFLRQVVGVWSVLRVGGLLQLELVELIDRFEQLQVAHALVQEALQLADFSVVLKHVHNLFDAVLAQFNANFLVGRQPNGVDGLEGEAASQLDGIAVAPLALDQPPHVVKEGISIVISCHFTVSRLLHEQLACLFIRAKGFYQR